MRKVIVVLKRGVNQFQVFENCKKLGLGNANLFKEINMITGVIPERLYNDLTKIVGVDHLSNEEGKNCSDGSCSKN